MPSHSSFHVPSLIQGRALWFPDLTAGPRVHGVVTLGWRIEDALSTDPWSRRFSSFKHGDLRLVRAAGAVACEALQLINWSRARPPVCITSVIGAHEVTLNPSCSLARLGRYLSDELSFEWHGDLLRNVPHQSLHRLSHVADRREAINGAFECIRSPNCGLLVVCDDLVTTGATLSDVARAIHKKSPTTDVIGFALAKNERRQFAHNAGYRLSNDHLPVRWAELWDHHARGRARME